MNITRENIDELNVVLKINIAKEDYEPRIDKVLRDHRRKMSMPGFRQGKVPIDVIKKMYGKSALVEEVNKILQEELFGYIKKENLNILGEPLPSEVYKTKFDVENQSEFEFAFDLGLSPKVDLSYTESMTFPSYKILVDDEIFNKVVDDYKERFGENRPVEIADVEDLLKGTVVELDGNGIIKEGGKVRENAIVSLKFFKDDAERQKFVGANLNQVINFNLKKALPLDTDIAYLLGIDKAEVADLSEEFEFTIENIQRFYGAELNEELYSKVFPYSEITTETEFNEKINEIIAGQFKRDTNLKFLLDLKKILIENTQLELPEQFLKRWLLAANSEKEDVTPERLEKEFPEVAESIKWQLIRTYLAKDNQITVSDEEIRDFGRSYARMQFANYGISDTIPDEYLDKYVDQILQKDDNESRFADLIVEQKIGEALFNKFKLDVIEISHSDFQKMQKQDVENQTDVE